METVFIRVLPVFPGCTKSPLDPNNDSLYEDINGEGAQGLVKTCVRPGDTRAEYGICMVTEILLMKLKLRNVWRTS